MRRTAPGAAPGDDDWISIAVRTDEEWRAAVRSRARAVGADGRARIAVERMTRRSTSMRRWPPGPRARSATCGRRNAADRPAFPPLRSHAHATWSQSPHLAARGFWDEHGAGVLPGTAVARQFRPRRSAPRRARRGYRCSACDDVLDLSPDRIAALRNERRFRLSCQTARLQARSCSSSSGPRASCALII